MDEKNELWNQYQTLRDEIKGSDTLNFQIIGVIIAAVVAIIIEGFKQTNLVTKTLTFICVYLVTIPGFQILLGNRRGIWRISTYLRVFIEPKLDHVKWETRLSKFSRGDILDISKGLKSSKMAFNEWLIISLMNFFATVAAISSLIMIQNLNTFLRIACIIGFAAFFISSIIITFKQNESVKRNGTVERLYFLNWCQVRDSESESQLTDSIPK